MLWVWCSIPICVVLSLIHGSPRPISFGGLWNSSVGKLERRPVARRSALFSMPSISVICQSLNTNGVFIAGMPSLESQKYASPQSKAGHVNCKSGLDFKKLLENHFHNVFLFSMNDEVVHTGFSPMAQYLLVLCAGKK